MLLTPCSSSVVIVERDVVKISRGGKKKPREKEEIQGEEDIYSGIRNHEGKKKS